MTASDKCNSSIPVDASTRQCFGLLFAHIGARLLEHHELVRAEMAFRTSLAIDSASTMTVPRLSIDIRV
jgi:hypothetical protein